MAEHQASIDLRRFSAEAERERRAGHLEEARRIAVAGLAEEPESLAGRLVLSLVLLDLGESQAARYELTRAVAGLPAHSALGSLPDESDATQSGYRDRTPNAAIGTASLGEAIQDAELDQAFDQASSVADEMRSANDVAEAVLRDESLVEADDFDPLADPAFATETMAALLEHQGDRGSAQAIRAALTRSRGAVQPEAQHQANPEFSSAEPSEGGERARLIATLEGWLANLRKMAR